jgi:hypothetical protein
MNANRSGPGCFSYGCLIAAVLFTTVIGGVAYWARQGLRGAVKQYTTETAPVLEVASVRPDVMSSGVTKFNQIQAAMDGRQPLSVSLSEDELRGIIEAGPFKGRLDVQLEGDQTSARFSVPLALLGDWQAARFLVDDIATRAIRGSAQGRFSITDGKPELRLSGLTLNESALGEMARGHAEEWLVGALVATGADISSGEVAAVPSWLSRIRTLRVEQGSVKIDLQ